MHPIATHEFDAVHDAQDSWLAGICGPGAGVTGQPGTRTLTDTAAPAPDPGCTTAGPAATALRRIRPRTATPRFLLDAGCYADAGDRA